MSMTSPDEQESPRIPRDSFAVRLAIIRTELGKNMSDMAELVGYPTATYRTWEKGAMPHDLVAVAKRIEERTGYDALWVIRGGLLLSTQLHLVATTEEPERSDPRLPFLTLV